MRASDRPLAWCIFYHESSGGDDFWSCPFRKSYPDVLVVQSSQEQVATNIPGACRIANIALFCLTMRIQAGWNFRKGQGSI
jgi:hypothetical protein